MNNAMIAAAMAKCNQQFGIAAAAFNQLSAFPDNLNALDAKYRLAKSVKPEDPLSMMPEAERREYLLLVAQQCSLAAMRGLFGVVNALVRERDAAPGSGANLERAIAEAIASHESQAAGSSGQGAVAPNAAGPAQPD